MVAEATEVLGQNSSEPLSIIETACEPLFDYILLRQLPVLRTCLLFPGRWVDIVN